MASLTIELDTAAVGEYLKSDSVKAMLESEAEAIAARCGDGYVADTYLSKTRYAASVRTKTKDAANDNLQNNTLLKALK